MRLALTPFTVHWPADQIAALCQRLLAFKPAPTPEGGGWAYGCDVDYLQRITAYWAEGYDFDAAQARLNLYPQYLAQVGDQVLHVVHVVGEAQGKRPLLLTHGWPGSVFEFWDAIEPLAYPSRFGGDPADAFDVVLPSLPGFGYSSPPKRPIGQRATASLFDRLMREGFGYETYLAQGGDWGGLVTGWLGLDHAAHVRGVHINMLGLRPADPPETADEKAWAEQGRLAMQAYGGYFMLQASKPQSLGLALSDTPVGQAAWILERFHDWSDLRVKSFETVYSFDQLLTNIMLYVAPNAFATSVWYYRALFEEGGAVLPKGVRVEVPTAFANFPGEAIYRNPPRTYAEKAYNVVRWTDMAAGGHFACMEEPKAFIADIQAFARDLDGQTEERP